MRAVIDHAGGPCEEGMTLMFMLAQDDVQADLEAGAGKQFFRRMEYPCLSGKSREINRGRAEHANPLDALGKHGGQPMRRPLDPLSAPSRCRLRLGGRAAPARGTLFRLPGDLPGRMAPDRTRRSARHKRSQGSAVAAST
jgi:hypothetical protein